MFRDAVPTELQDSYKDWYEEPRNIMMGGPKITATEFYMDDAGGEVFTYDYSVRGNDRTPISPRLRGRKFYWHCDRQENAPNDANVNMLKTIHPVKSGKNFYFTVAFDRLTKEELAKLQFALTLAFQDGDVHDFCDALISALKKADFVTLYHQSMSIISTKHSQPKIEADNIHDPLLVCQRPG